MGLPSAINLRIAQVDPATLIPAASRTTDNSGAFEQHLDATDTPAARATDRRDDQRQRDSSSTDTAQASSQETQPASNGGQETTPTTASTVPADATPTAATETAPADASAAATTDTTAAAPAASDTETTASTVEAGLADAQAAIVGDAGKGAKPHDDKAEEKSKAPDQPTDTSLAALLMAQPAPLKQTPASNAAPVSTEIAPAASNAATGQQPAAPEHSALADAAAQSAMTDAQTADTSGDASTTGSETDLAVKPKLEGLGHQAAASMADKSADRQAAAQGAQTAFAQATNPQAVAATPATPNQTAAANTASDDAGTQPISATSGPLAAQLSDLQGANTAQQSNANNATIRIGTLPGQTTPSIVPSMAIALQIARNVQKGINRFDIRLDPPELGRIDVRMEVQRDGHVAAHLTVESAQTLDLLQRDQRALQQALTDAGLQTNSDSLSFSLRDQNAGSNAQGSAGNAGGGGSGSDIASIEETPASTGPIYNLNLSASGGVDIRV